MRARAATTAARHPRSGSRLLLRIVLALAASLAAPGARGASESPAVPALPDGLYAEFVMPRGSVVAELFYEQVPLTVVNFVARAEGHLDRRNGRACYAGLTWYRVVPGFVIQSGDPEFAPDKPDDPTPNPLAFPDEFRPGLYHDGPGVLSMANAGPDTNAGEFFITLADTTRLNYLHSVFGRAVRGRELLDQIAPNETIQSVRIVRVGAAARAFVATAQRFEELRARAKAYTAAREPGPTAHFDDPDHVLPTTPPRAQAFNFKLANFERATGWPVYARVLAKLPPTTSRDIALDLARQPALPPRGAVAVYEVQTDRWTLWLGDESARRITAGSAGDSAADEAVSAAQKGLLESAKRRADSSIAAAARGAPPDRPITAAQRIKVEVDAVLDGLLLALEP